MEVRTKMDQKVQEMRGQTMTFSNDGMELSLNVPDTNDVKRVFGTMIDTVSEQQDEIGHLNTELDHTVKENRVARQKIVSATTDKLQQLLAQQLKMEQQLLDAQKNIQNFAYNIQGYVDEHENESAPTEALLKSHYKIAQNLTLDIGDDVPDDSSIRSGPVTLFPTEDGASPTKLSTGMNSSALPTFHPATQNQPKKKRNKSLMESSINYQTIPNYTMPKNNIAGKWRWAIKKVLSNIRRKKLKIGFTRTRVEKKQTIAGRLDQIDLDMFVIPQKLSKEFQEKLNSLSEEVNQNINNVKQDLTTYAEATDAHISETDAKVAEIADKISSHDERITKMIDALAEKEQEDMRIVNEQLAVLRKQVRDEVHLEMTRLTQTLKDLTGEFAEVDTQAKQVMRDIKNTTILSENPPEDRGVDLLTQLLDKDKATRLQAHKMGVIEGHVDVLHRLLVETKEGVAAMHDLYMKRVEAGAVQYPVLSPEDMQTLEDLAGQATVSEGMTKSVKDSLSIMYGMLQRHDELLRDTAHAVLCESVQALDILPGLQTQLSSAISSNSAVQESVKNLQAEKNALQDQVSNLRKDHSDVKEKVESTEKLLQGQDIGRVAEEMDKMRNQMDSFKTMIGGMQSQMMTIFQNMMQQKMTGGGTGGGTRSTRQSASAPLRASMVVPQGAAPPIPKEVGNIQANVTLPTVAAQEASMTSASGIIEEESAVSGSVAAVNGEESVSVEIVNDQHNQNDDNESSVFPGGEMNQDEGGDEDPMAMMHQMMAMMLPSGNTSTTNMVAPSMMGDGMMMMGGGGNGMMMGGVTEERVEEIIRGILEGMELPSISNSPAPAAGKNKSRQVSLAVPSQDDAPSGSKVKRQPSGLMGSFADYNARKSLSRIGGGSFASPSHNAGGQSLMSEHGFDPAPLLADIANIRAEAFALQKQLEALNEEKTGKPDVEKVCMDIIREYRKREARTDYRTMLEDMDVSMREVVHELIGMKKEQDRLESTLRKEFEDALSQALNETKKDLIDASKESVLSTKGLCLGCGRSSMVKMESSSRPMSPSFLPALNAHMQPGPDILRGGFKMPGRPLSPPTSYPEIPLLMRHRVQTAPTQAAEAAYQARRSYFVQGADQAANNVPPSLQQQPPELTPSVTLLQSPTRSSINSSNNNPGGLRVGFADDEPDILLPVRHSSVGGEGSESLTVTMPTIPLSQITPNNNNDSYDLAPSLEIGPASNSSNPNTNRSALRSSNGNITPTSSNNNHGNGSGGGSIVRTNVNASETETLRPLYRKGFPASKKSLKAELAYAPERFDLAVRSLGGSSLLSAGSTASSGGLGVLNNATNSNTNNNSTSLMSQSTSNLQRPSTVSAILSANNQHSNGNNHLSNGTKNVQSRSTVSFA